MVVGDVSFLDSVGTCFIIFNLSINFKIIKMRNNKDITTGTIKKVMELSASLSKYTSLTRDVADAVDQFYDEIPAHDKFDNTGMDDSLLCGMIALTGVRSLDQGDINGHDFTIAIAGSSEVVSRMLAIAMLRNKHLKDSVERAFQIYRAEDGKRILEQISDI
jgi:hypothetical protein